MKTQIFKLDTKFTIGKHQGKTLRQVIENYESRYIGFLIVDDVSWFIMHPDTIDFLEKQGFFDDLDMSYYGSGGSMPLSWIGYDKENIVGILRNKYEEYIKDPEEYERKATAKYSEYLRNKNSVNSSNKHNSNDVDEDYDIDKEQHSDYFVDDVYDEPLDEEEAIMRAIAKGEGDRFGYG